MAGPTFGLGPQARTVARLAEGGADAQLADGTPCPRYADQNSPAALLPPELRDDNPQKLPRRLNGSLER